MDVPGGAAPDNALEPAEGLACFYPAPPPPLPIHLVTSPEHACAYLPNRLATTRLFRISDLPGRIYHEFMDASFRRSGTIIYQPVCRGCRACMPLRVQVAKFVPNKSQRRCARRNDDLIFEVAVPAPSDEKFSLYQRYQSTRHGEKQDEDSRQAFESFLYDSPVETIEFTYRDRAGRLLAVGICDICSASLSSVYFYFDPEESSRGLGTYGVLKEIALARENSVPYYYMGYWVEGSPKMNYKASFLPHQILGPDGSWTDVSTMKTLSGHNTGTHVKV